MDKKAYFLAVLLGWVLAAGGHPDVKVEFMTPSIVHVVKGQPTKTLVVTLQPQQVEVAQKGTTMSSSELTVKQDAQGNRFCLTRKCKVLWR